MIIQVAASLIISLCIAETGRKKQEEINSSNP